LQSKPLQKNPLQRRKRNATIMETPLSPAAHSSGDFAAVRQLPWPDRLAVSDAVRNPLKTLISCTPDQP